MERIDEELYCVFRVLKKSNQRTQSERANIAPRGGTV
jgi:hypothetical protein